MFETSHLLLEVKNHMAPSAAYNENFGQLADYALNVRGHQPMRTFIPILFLYGGQLDLLVFTHGGYYKSSIGQVLYTFAEDKSENVSRSPLRLWFLLTLSSTDFGNLLPTIGRHWSLYIDDSLPHFEAPSASRDTDSGGLLRASLSEIPRSQESRLLTDIDRIDREVRITGRCTYIFSAMLEEKPVVLKLTWIQKKRRSEGAVYEILQAHNVPNVPRIICSGVVVEDVGGYRLELVLMDHCGEAFVDHVIRKRDDLTNNPYVLDITTNSVKDIVTTLATALDAGGLHRDISASNLAISGAQVRVIDWGCAKVLNKPSDAALADGIASRWGVNWVTAVKTGEESDAFTGTPLYMSVQMLLRVRSRSIYNDIESLFYVVLDALSDRVRNDESKSVPGFRYCGRVKTALLRLGCLCSFDHALCRFGVQQASLCVPDGLLNAMHAFLFFEKGAFIGHKLQYDNGCEWVFYADSARVFMNKATCDALVKDFGLQQDALPGYNDYNELQAAVNDRRRRLANQLSGQVKSVEFDALMGLIGLVDKFDVYDETTSATFSRIAKIIPTIPVSKSDVAPYEDDYVDIFKGLSVA
ncbi:hypothetical protein IWW38_001795 [Coemansia aciculifera]|uniref:Uncharacterized protein n=1 Tax=Coemansia aciculifera TaxID=417176 RepID=A0ACC1M609_9FUNG|nr:hypothetical protein IWW38_001795 [Coemansia aciculifera]